MEVLWVSQDVVFEIWVGRRGTYPVIHVLVLRGTNDHLVGLGRFVGGRVGVHVDILGLLRLGSVATAVSEGARLHHFYGRHDAFVDCICRLNVHQHAHSGVGVHLVLGVVGSAYCLIGVSVRSERVSWEMR